MYLEILTTNGLDPERDREKWEYVVAQLRPVLIAKIPDRCRPYGTIAWEAADDCREPLIVGQRHWRLRMNYR